MELKNAKAKAGVASNSNAIDKMTNIEISDYGLVVAMH